MQPQPIADWGTSISNSFMNAVSTVLTFIPKILGFLIILLVGWLVIKLIARVVVALLRLLKVDEFAQRSGFSETLRNIGIKTGITGVISGVIRFFLWLVVLTAAFDALDLRAVSTLFQQWMAWIPNLFVGLVVLIFGALVANFVGDFSRGAAERAKLRNPEIIATISRVAVWSFAFIIALNQMGIAEVVVNTLFIGLVAALALASGLAFGLGGQGTADQIVHRWYELGQQRTEGIKQEAGRPDGGR